MTKHGCWNRESFRAELKVQDGWTPGGERAMRWIPFRMTTDCQYSKDPVNAMDVRCAGCRWKAKSE